jgi:hypothetical protein
MTRLIEDAFHEQQLENIENLLFRLIAAVEKVKPEVKLLLAYPRQDNHC